MKLRKCAVVISSIMAFSVYAQDQIIQEGVDNTLTIDKTSSSMVYIEQLGAQGVIKIDQLGGTGNMATVSQGPDNLGGLNDMDQPYMVFIEQKSSNNNANVHTNSTKDEVAIRQGVVSGGEGNHVYVHSASNNMNVLELNVFNVDQESSNSRVNIHNDGSENHFQTMQMGNMNWMDLEVLSDFEHFSQLNTFVMEQSGDNNGMWFVFKGSNNTLMADQGGSGNFMSVMTLARSPEEVVEEASSDLVFSGNTLNFTQSASSMNSHIYFDVNFFEEPVGDIVNNFVTVNQDTTDSSIQGRFHGNDNNVVLSQIGEGHNLTIDAGGLSNTLNVDMSGSLHNIHVNQWGATNVMNITAIGSMAELWVDQFGTGNISNINIGEMLPPPPPE